MTLTPAQHGKPPETATAVMEGGEQQGVEVQSLHQEPEEVSHHTVVTEHHRGLTGSLDRKEVEVERKREKERERERQRERERGKIGRASCRERVSSPPV